MAENDEKIRLLKPLLEGNKHIIDLGYGAGDWTKIAVEFFGKQSFNIIGIDI